MLPPSIITGDVRGALVRYFKDKSAKPDAIWSRYAQEQGYGTLADYMRDCDRRFGPGAGDALRARMSAEWQELVSAVPRAQAATPQSVANVELSQRPYLWFRAMPDADFVVALECALALARNHLALHDLGMPPTDIRGHLVEHVNGLFARRAVPYRVDYESFRVVADDDAGPVEVALRPALAALEDARLLSARSEFEDALAKSRSVRPKDLEDAVEESRKAVESAMKVVLQARGVTLSGKETTWPLHNALVANGVLPQHTDQIITAAARLANADASHGAGTEVRDVRPYIARAAVAAAANAITLLAARLPAAAGR